MVHQRYKQQNNKGVYIQCICSSMLLSVWKQFNFSLSKDLLSYNIHFPGFYYSNWEVLLGKWCNTIGDTHRHGFTEDPESFRYQALAGSQINSINKKRNKSVCVWGGASMSSSFRCFWHVDCCYSGTIRDLTLSWWVLYIQCAEVSCSLMPNTCHLHQQVTDKLA